MRKLDNWLDAFVEYGHVGEAPDHTLFWCGVSTLAGALGRRCWLPQVTFKWYPNMFVVIVAPPGVIAKTSTGDIGMDLLKEIDGIHFGPNVVTWQALVKSFKKTVEVFEYTAGKPVEIHQMTIYAGEFGNFMHPDDRDCMDMLVTLWDCKNIHKETIGDGEVHLDNTCLNVLGCTTPGWISGAVPLYMIEGGLISRVIWVYGEDKRELVAYQREFTQRQKDLRRYLLDDLNVIAKLEGPFTLTPEAVTWGDEWYKKHNELHCKGQDDSRFGGFYARKQTHIHKLAMILSVAKRNDLVIGREELEQAEYHISALEGDLRLIFDRIGRSEVSNHSDRIIEYVHQRPEGVPIEEVQRHMRVFLPKQRDFDEVLKTLLKGKVLKSVVREGKAVLIE